MELAVAPHCPRTAHGFNLRPSFDTAKLSKLHNPQIKRRVREAPLTITGMKHIQVDEGVEFKGSVSEAAKSVWRLRGWTRG